MSAAIRQVRIAGDAVVFAGGQSTRKVPATNREKRLTDVVQEVWGE